jgi:hypothetical protein
MCVSMAMWKKQTNRRPAQTGGCVKSVDDVNAILIL